MSVCVPHPNFGCLIRHCALFCQNASRVYVSGPGPWEVSLASSRMLQIMTPMKKLDHKWAGPFTITKVVSPAAIKLCLSTQEKNIHPVISVSSIHCRQG